MPASTDPWPSVPISCLAHLLEHQANRIPDAPAILAPGRAPLTYGRLYQHIDKTGRTLRAMGIGHRDRVGVVLPNGPELAVAILAVAAIGACVPMNPAYGSEELDRYLADLRPGALITLAGIDSPARRAAVSRGIRVIELSTAFDAEAGLFALTGDQGGVPSDEPVSSAGDVALLLPTSGTTSRPKIVPLTHANICASAYASGAALTLRETDRCLNVLPLFHGHGFNATVLTSLAAGASVVCTPGCDVNSFFAWLAFFQPTWYSAVPTMHQAILAHARRNRLRVTDGELRFVRSSSAPLPPRVFTELEWTFGTPVIEFYGMTETASSPIACNPLPPWQRKAGSVGIKVGLDVAIMDEGGALVSRGQRGQVVVRGASVMSGYDGNEMATHAAFSGDWFKTGDLGFFDDDGYLFLVGRIGELINRGGEKVAPKEVDEVLLEHPAVEEAVTFSVPHSTLGEDVASAIVLRPDAVATAKDIRQFAIGRMADFKVPRQILIVREIPKGPTGKVQRIGLAAKLGVATSGALPRAFVAPRTVLEKVLAKHWAEILQVEQIGIHDDFFGSGGDSLLATDVLAHVYNITRVELDVARFVEGPTIAEVAHHLERLVHAGQASQPSSAIVRVPRENGTAAASIAQERLWKLQHALPDIPFFNILYPLRLISPCDVAVLERSINEIVRRHEILRTTLAHINGRYVQVIAPQLAVPLAFDDLRALPRKKKETIGHQLIQEEVRHSFDLAKGPLIRARLVHLAEQEHLFLISMHQIVCDGWSLGVFVEELVALYDAFSGQEESPLAPLSIQYADFAHWQRHLHSELIAQLEYWREQLREPLPVVHLATSSPRRAIDDLRTARREWMLPAGLAEAAKRFSRQEGGTLYMALVAALKTLLHRYLGQDDVWVATNVANRNRPGTEALIGPLVNTVILRTDLGGDPTAREVMRRVRLSALAAFAHQDLPFEELVQTLERERRFAMPVNAMMILQNSALRPTANSGHKLCFEEANPNMLVPLVTITSFDVIFMLRETPRGLAGICVYKPHRLKSETIDRLLRDFQEVLECMTTQPEQPISAIRVSLNEQTSSS
ncbi:Acyl-CoA synthetase (AMP-forming)/AMP-acid ligase II [Bradyrhizobium lablabi]|uniref:Acyl-CoA synthetase (AMP-forming)/AMP-acid ligase II n=1 Tax=Bradyrhizobium lablabi TaxID=722472 RepID=A0A1M6TQY7_9BRAD|nr:condensation domain-containing protein [Bradyrhizobium lablabi]SHK59228.1 Acyl-CoA synthetase (AMP-forming)/AMP-acid ligase II [Bradyrhizobium lablabi]